MLVSEYILTYAALLFTSQERIKAPKNARSNNIDRVIEGCKNQAWDIAYLTNWSVWYSNTDEYAEEMLFATNDTDTMKEITKLKRTGDNDRDIVFRLVRIICAIWQIHPFREGNTRSVIVFAVLLAKKLGFEVDHELFRVNSSYVRNALVWGAQGIYSKYEYLERIFFDAILHENVQDAEQKAEEKNGQYEKIGDYKVKNYVERPHEYVK